eukprot:5619318-Alexandrium_andersonii.AAC.1
MRWQFHGGVDDRRVLGPNRHTAKWQRQVAHRRNGNVKNMRCPVACKWQLLTPSAHKYPGTSGAIKDVWFRK